MDGNKALNYLLIIFLMLNIFLGFGNYQKYIAMYRLSDDNINKIIDFLESENILIDTQLPKEYMPTNTIYITPIDIGFEDREFIVDAVFGSGREGVIITEQADGTSYNTKSRVYTRENKSLIFSTYQVEYKNDDIRVNYESNISEREAKKYAEDFFKIYGATFLEEKVKIEYKKESYGASITYYEVYNNLPVFDSYVYMAITDDGVFESTLQISDIKQENNDRLEIYAVTQVLFKLNESLDSSEMTTINEIMLGYAREQVKNAYFVKEKAIPMYKITTEGLNIPLFVNAYTNELK
ncbi:MAG: hypothetical protein ATN35_03075 [Epulopiscium sp. Nele67-Bin004]|nr:MAG: hypothetical protein ATN35_03075 [Epulopiscium sp. Nele67-Bin004]